MLTLINFIFLLILQKFLLKQIVKTDLPEMKRQKGPQKATDSEKKEFSALFDSDSDDNDMDLTERLAT